MRRGHDGARNGEHLLLSSGKQAGVLGGTLPEDGEVVVDGLDVARYAVSVLAGVSAHQEVVANREQRKDLAALGNVAQALLDDICGILGGNVPALEFDA